MAAKSFVQEVAIETKGRGYVAETPIAQGVIVMEEKPFAFVVKDVMEEI